MSNLSNKRVHIISFDVPYPANYGGVIDVYHKIRMLHRAGVKIVLHCFDYGRGVQPQLEQLCSKVYYYQRQTGIVSNFSLKPYVVMSRQHPDLLRNLLVDDAPILFEGLHSCALIGHKELKSRFKIYRESNIEHHYYHHLAKAEQNLFKKVFFLAESVRLFFFQSVLKNADLMLTVSEEDNNYLKNQFPAKSIAFLPSFHANDRIDCQTGMGNYALYQGKLSVAENDQAVRYLINEVFAHTDNQFMIAGMDPDAGLKKLVSEHRNIKLIANPDQETMNKLTAEAQVNVMVTFQPTGLKLKLINTLYRGRHCLVNSLMLAGTNLDALCTIADSPVEFNEKLQQLMVTPFTTDLIELRQTRLKPFDNQFKTDRLIACLYSKTDR